MPYNVLHLTPHKNMTKKYLRLSLLCGLAAFTCHTAFAQPNYVEFSSDNDSWGGSSMGTSHQNNNEYWTEKTLTIPESALNGVKQARLRVFMTLQDNSAAGGKTANGLDEAFELVVNGKPHLFQNNDPALPSRASSKVPLVWKWHDFVIPVAELKPGVNTFVFRKTPSPKNDDFLYIGIDNSISKGQSRSSLNGGKSWTSELNTIKATGEYMVRLLLLNEVPQSQATWTPQRLNDPQKLIGYQELNGNNLRFELDSYRYDSGQPLRATLSYQGTAPQLRWFDENEKEIEAKTTTANGQLTSELLYKTAAVSRLEVQGNVQQVRFDYALPVGGGSAHRIDMAPQVQAPRGRALTRKPEAIVDVKGFTLQNDTLAARFETSPRLKLASLRNEYLQKNVLAHPQATRLFLTEIEGKRYGAADWTVEKVRKISPTQVAVDLRLPSPAMQAQLTFNITNEGLRFGLQMTNASRGTLSWKTAFPHLGGLQLSEKTEDDYYLFPLWGGAIANANVNLKTYYGDESAWWQMVSLYSPTGGAGMLLRNLDESGLYKGVLMRKNQRAVAEGTLLRDIRSPGTGGYMADDMGWQQTLDAAPGIATTFEYLKFTREPGKSFSPPDALLQMHSGDWQNAMQTYATWARKVWKWQPFPTKLRDVWNFQAAGWGQSPAFRDGKWRLDYAKAPNDVIELMSWWQWSKKGPWQTPMDRLKEELGERFYQEYKSYWVVNPATGQLEYPLNRGDYDYNTDWGGLPALRQNLQDMRDRGVVPMFYTDPILADDNTKLGQQYGAKYGVMNPLWKPGGYASDKKTPAGYVGSYGGWCMCLDTQWYQDFVVNLTARLVRDTGVDGIRFDEFGHRGYVCHNPQHTHLFAEPGHNAWMQAVTQATRRTQNVVKKIKPDFVLTAEFPGNDHLAAALDGSINYESAQHVFPSFRPVPLNVMRFYFPEHKQYDLDTTGRAKGLEWRFWNATGAAFSMHAHPPRYHRILKENSDAFDSREVTALAPSLAQGVYANRFVGGGKTITLLYNARGFTVDQPLMAAPAKAGYHYFDLLNGKEIVPQNNVIGFKLRADKVAAVAHLPQVLQVTKTNTGHTARLARKVDNAKLIVCAADGTPLETKEITGQEIAVANAQAAYVKLIQGEYLLDAASL
jgi:hypothetical protein